MCIIVMYADHNGLCIGPSFQCNVLYLDICFLIFIVSSPDFEIFLAVVIYDDARASIVIESGNGKWPRAAMWRVAVVELLSGNSGLELLMGTIQRSLLDDTPVVSIGSHCMMAGDRMVVVIGIFVLG